MHTPMNTFRDIILNRRTVKPDRYTGKRVADDLIWQVLEAANWAPTHGFTEPWRFQVFADAAKKELLDFLNKLDEQLSGANAVVKAKRAKRFEATSHVLTIGMKRGDNPKIPEIEELLALGAAVQNMWLTAHSLGLGSYWSTGKLAFRPELAEFMGLDPQRDKSLGFFYIGDPVVGIPVGRRLSSIQEKVDWR
jgi:nitroreductase